MLRGEPPLRHTRRIIDLYPDWYMHALASSVASDLATVLSQATNLRNLDILNRLVLTGATRVVAHQACALSLRILTVHPIVDCVGTTAFYDHRLTYLRELTFMADVAEADPRAAFNVDSALCWDMPVLRVLCMHIWNGSYKAILFLRRSHFSVPRRFELGFRSNTPQLDGEIARLFAGLSLDSPTPDRKCCQFHSVNLPHICATVLHVGASIIGPAFCDHLSSSVRELHISYPGVDIHDVSSTACSALIAERASVTSSCLAGRTCRRGWVQTTFNKSPKVNLMNRL
jgi:hypothetical protein